MSAKKTLLTLSHLTAWQAGLVTTAQAAQAGITRLELSRLASDGFLQRVSQGVYRHTGAPSDQLELLRAAWLSLDPELKAEQRISKRLTEFVVMGESAAELHGIGVFHARQHEFSCKSRKQTQRKEIKLRSRKLDKSQVTIQKGLPVTTVEQTLVDLLETHGDLSNVAIAFADAYQSGRTNSRTMTKLLNPLAKRHGLKANDGQGLLNLLLEIGGINDAAQSRKKTA